MNKNKPIKKSNKNQGKSKKSDNMFWFNDGRAVKNIKELAFILDDIDDHIFGCHIKEKNDFAVWIKHKFNNHGLANAISSIKDKSELQSKLYGYIKKEVEDGNK